MTKRRQLVIIDETLMERIIEFLADVSAIETDDAENDDILDMLEDTRSDARGLLEDIEEAFDDPD